MKMKSRGQTQLDFGISILLFFVFLTTVVTVPASPVFLGGYYTNDLATDTHQTAVYISESALTNAQGEITNQEINDLLKSGSPMESYIRSDDDLNGNVTLQYADNIEGSPTDRGKPPSSIPGGRGSIGPTPPDIGTETISKMAVVDGKLVEIQVTLWYK
jgi:uncharacterized protein (UPF0333 family)